MKTTIYIFFLILLFSNGKAQQSQSVDSKNSISNNFNKQQISAYQNGSLEKFEQFAEYFNLIQETQDSELKEQLKQNVFSLFENPETEIIDFFASNEKITVRQFLNKYQNSNQIIKVISMKSDVSIFQNFWINIYQIIDNSGEIITLKQTIIFQKQEKKFGKNSKEVWEIKLGTLEL
ncbi:MAG: hypothetical protein E2590_01195 [Chryseobacterium sp.]|nr:hypothetical protein [Chryseobacterium sp.]